MSQLSNNLAKNCGVLTADLSMSYYSAALCCDVVLTPIYATVRSQMDLYIGNCNT